MQEILDRLQRRSLVEPARIDAKAFRSHLHQIKRIELAGNNRRRGQANLVDRLHQVADQCRLARSNFTGDDNEAFTLRKAIAEIGQRLTVRSALEIIMRIGSQLERAPGQAIILVVHLVYLPCHSPLKAVPEPQQCRSGYIAIGILWFDAVDTDRCPGRKPPPDLPVIGCICTDTIDIRCQRKSRI